MGAIIRPCWSLRTSRWARRLPRRGRGRGQRMKMIRCPCAVWFRPSRGVMTPIMTVEDLPATNGTVSSQLSGLTHLVDLSHRPRPVRGNNDWP